MLKQNKHRSPEAIQLKNHPNTIHIKKNAYKNDIEAIHVVLSLKIK